MTHDSCSYIVSAVPLPFIKQYHSPPRSGISVLSLLYLNAVLSFSISYSASLSFSPCFWASSKVLFPFTFSSCLTSLVWLVQILSSGRWCSAGVREVGFEGGRLQDGVEVDSQRTAENLTSAHIRMTLNLNTQWVRQQQKKKQSQMMKELYAKASTHTENPPQSPADTLLPCIINEWQLCSPMDSTWNMM